MRDNDKSELPADKAFHRTSDVFYQESLSEWIVTARPGIFIHPNSYTRMSAITHYITIEFGTPT